MMTMKKKEKIWDSKDTMTQSETLITGVTHMVYLFGKMNLKMNTHTMDSLEIKYII